MRRTLQLALLVSLITCQAFAKQPPVVLTTIHSAMVGRAPMTVRFHATVLADEHNRQLCFDWVSDRSSGQGCTSLDGDRAPLTFWRDITFRTGGEFIVSARVERNDNHTYLSNIVVIRVLTLGE